MEESKIKHKMKKLIVTACVMSWSSSVSIVTDYGLDNQGSIPSRSKDFFSSLCVQTCSEFTQPSIQWVLGVLSLGVKHGWDMTLTTQPHVVPRG
jgi:hypothetical protein